MHGLIYSEVDDTNVCIIAGNFSEYTVPKSLNPLQCNEYIREFFEFVL